MGRCPFFFFWEKALAKLPLKKLPLPPPMMICRLSP
jgi:hypothetical protein